jgi:hypothetical protein
MLTDAGERADKLLRSYVLSQFRAERHPQAEHHIAACGEARVLEFYSGDGVYCESGCEYLRLEATIGCPHAKPVEYRYGEFGEIAMLVEDLIAEEGRRA